MSSSLNDGRVKKSPGSHNAVAMTSEGPRRRAGGREKTHRARNKGEGRGNQCCADVGDQEGWRRGGEVGEGRRGFKGRE